MNLEGGSVVILVFRVRNRIVRLEGSRLPVANIECKKKEGSGTPWRIDVVPVKGK